MKRRNVWLLSIPLTIFLSGCADLPRDQHGASTRIRQRAVLTVGASHESAQLTPLEKREKRLVEKIARRLGARIEWRSGNRRRGHDGGALRTRRFSRPHQRRRTDGAGPGRAIAAAELAAGRRDRAASRKQRTDAVANS